ncbi:MAG: Gfo/Idh/MocA family oxidoreductase [Candidatus Marinimicrobia bacterium]|nr:Gfo/Idh/MocA family oxidoreductase [Candidatus Neomarinimicrobiota bacterium]
MKNQVLKVGIVGVGRFGSRHLQKWLQMNNIEFVGFNDIDPKACDKVKKEHGISCYPLDDLIDKVDILDIVVPISQHYQITKKALEARKHVFVEKSFTETLDQAEELTSLASRKGVKVGIGHIERYNPVLIELKEQLIEPPSKLLAFRQGPFIPEVGLDVSIILELMIHDIDMITHFIPYPIESIQAQGEIIHSDKIDRATAIINFANGSEAILFASRAEEERRREVLCTDGDVDYKADLMNRKLSSTKNNETLDFKFVDAMMDELTAFVESVRTGRNYLVNAYTGCNTVEIAEEIEKEILKSLFE